MTVRAESDPPNLQYFLRVSQIGKRQPSAKKPRNSLVLSVESVNPSRSAMRLLKCCKTTGTHLSCSLVFALADYDGREFEPEQSGESRRRLTGSKYGSSSRTEPVLEVAGRPISAH